MKKSLLFQKITNALVVLSALVITAVLYVHLGRDYLFDWDEGIYAELGSEMISSGKIFTPTWGGEVWLEKPPGIAWISAIGLSLFGHNSFGARLLMPLFAFVSLITIYKIGKFLLNSFTGFISMYVLAYFDLFLSRSRGVNTDGPLLTSILLTVYLSLSSSHPGLIALAVFTGVWMKGVAGLLSLIVVLPIFYKNLRDFAKVVFYSVLYLLPWHLYQYLVYKDRFYKPYFFEHVLQRFSVPIEYHVGNRWFYLNFLYENIDDGMIMVAFLGIILALYHAFKKKKIELLFPLWWFSVILVIFTLAKTKLVWYILPAFPAVAILIAFAVSSLAVTKNAKRVLAILVIGMFLQTTLKVARSVEVEKSVAPIPEKIQAAQFLSSYDPAQRVIVYVPHIERIFYEIMPEDQRISSSFRYGGMPSLLFYLEKPVTFYYTKAELNNFWENAVEHPYAIFSVDDKKDIPPYSEVLYENKDYLVAKRGDMYVIIRDLNRLKRKQLNTF